MVKGKNRKSAPAHQTLNPKQARDPEGAAGTRDGRGPLGAPGDRPGRGTRRVTLLQYQLANSFR